MNKIYYSIQRSELGTLILENNNFKNLKLKSFSIKLQRIGVSKSGEKKFENQQLIRIHKLQNVNFNNKLTQFMRK